MTISPAGSADVVSRDQRVVVTPQGRCLMGMGRLYDNRLVEIMMPSILDGMLRGLCIHCFGARDADRFVVREISRVVLGALANNTNLRAQILEVWEEPA
jgi:hypothetical protein